MERDDNHLSRFSLYVYVVRSYACLWWQQVALANHGLKSMKGYQQMSYEQIAHMTGTKGEAAESEILESSFSATENKTIRKLKKF